jgi:tetraacyldisaccharide 4'-kinase
MLPLRNPFRMLSLLYGSGVTIRNKMFDNGMLKSMEFDVPTISIGNLRVGGTGKTPCTEWLLEKLGSQYKIAVLSRGYGRRTKGFRWVNVTDSARDVGDESLQVKQKFPVVPIAVSEDRVTGIVQLLADEPVDLILLDDAYQHRYVKPTYSIVLSAFHQPFFNDELLPVGRLREHPKHLKRADCVIYTKCPDDWQEKQRLYIDEAKHYAPNALVAFSKLVYDTPQPLFDTTAPVLTDVILVTGIADAKPLYEHLEKDYHVLRHYPYPDHYRFMSGDVENWRKEIKANYRSSPVIFTTEKDAKRLTDMKESLKGLPIYFVPMKMEMIDDLMKRRIEAHAKQAKSD